MPHKHTPDDLTALIKQRYRSKAAFAEAIGIPAHTLYSILSGESFTTCSLANAMAITRALNLDPYAFAEGHLKPATQVEQATLAPIYEEYKPGVKPIQIGAFPVPRQLMQAHPKAFMLRIQDNSMNRILPPGFLALIIPCSEFDAMKTLYAVSTDSAPAIIRKYIQHDNGFTLAPVSLDPTYEPILVNSADASAQTIKPIGRVIWFCSPVD